MQMLTLQTEKQTIVPKMLIEKMKGKIEVISSKENKTVEFLVYLPVYEVEKLTKIGVEVV